MSKKPEPEAVETRFDLLDLPTAQHRAGLAGLILQIDSMGPEKNKRSPKLVPEIVEVTRTTAKIRWTRESTQGVFDDLYAAKPVEIVVATKWPGETKPKPGEYFISKKDLKSGEVEQTKGFAYDVVQPQAPCLASHLKGGDKSAWFELWRQMVWSILRGGNNVRSRAPFNDLARDLPCGDGATAWSQLVAFGGKPNPPTAPISGALMLGAQAINAEAVPFQGRVDQNLLLHFWQAVVLTYVPHSVSKKDAKVERVGYVLAIPDVSDLVEFRRVFPEVLDGFDPKRTRGMPDAARLDMPDQAGLEVLRLADASPGPPPGGPVDPRTIRARSRVEKRVKAGGTGQPLDRSGATMALASAKLAGGWQGSIRAVECYHMFKLGNNVKLLSFSRVVDRPGFAGQYPRIKNFRNPLYRAARVGTLLRDRAWHSGMLGLFAEYPWTFFIQGDESPKYLPRFGRDAREEFRSFAGSIEGMEIREMDDEEKTKHLGLVLQRLMNRYVDGRAAAKLNLKLDQFVKVEENGRSRRVPPDPKDLAKYQEHQRRVCSDAFLAMRSRHDQDFVTFFAGSVCSVGQFLPAADYQFLIQTLLTNPDPNPVGAKRLCWEDVKAIAMIAISAHSFNVRERTDKPEEARR